MRLLTLSLPSCLLCAIALPAQQPAVGSRTGGSRAGDPVVSTYHMTVKLDAEAKTLHGTQDIDWTNTTRFATSELRFHLYMNAFADTRSSHMREAGPEFRSQWRANEFGRIEVKELRLVGEASRDLTGLAEFIHPDDGNADDRTVMRVALPSPVGPGAKVRLRTRFEVKLPKAYRRTGYLPGDGFFCMQWFPKLGVLEERSGEARWNCHQFHANTEFFADYSRYKVEIDVPKGFVVGATGGEGKEQRAGPGRRILVFVAEPVHDFAWVADPDFVVKDAIFGPVKAADDPVCLEVAAAMGVAVSTFDLPRTRMRLLLRPEHASAAQIDRHLHALRTGLRFFGLRYGPYPYSMITAVDPGKDVLGHRLGGGMEYPMLITCGTALFPHPRRLQPEGVVVHEFGHQYWYGLSGNNEFEESWLDEGINSFSEGRAQWLEYGATMRPVQTTGFGLLTVAGTTGGLLPRNGLAALSRLPWLHRLPSAVRARLAALHFEGRLLPASPLLDLLRIQPVATLFREARTTSCWNDRASFLGSDDPDPMVKKGWLYLSRQSYRANSYARPATVLNSLERIVGRRRFWTFMRKFHTQARFHHPTTEQFEMLLAAECGERAARFFREATMAGAVLDYGIGSVTPADGNGRLKEVIIRRLGGLTADLRVRFRFSSRSEPVVKKISAEDRSPWWRFAFDDAALPDGEKPYGKLLEVWIDPPLGTGATGEPFEGPGGPVGEHLLDANLLDNAWKAMPDRRPALYRGIRMLLEAQSQLSFAGLIG